jgi:predicted dehydrogenase
MEKLRVGFIGAGRISDLHATEYLSNERTELIAVCDSNIQYARERGRKWGVPEKKIFDNHQDLLAQKDVDLVEILTPHHLHFKHTIDAAAAGKHISLQKPMAISVAEADKMIAETEKAGVIFKVFENFIFYPPIMRAKDLVEAGEIGTPLTIRLKSNAAFSPNAWVVPQTTQAWRFDPDTCGGGPLAFDDGHHKFSIGWFFMGIADEVHAWIGNTHVNSGVNQGNLDSPAIISWKFPGNRYGSLEVVYSHEMIIDTNHYSQDDRIEITGTKGVIWVTRGHGKLMDIPPVVLYKNQEIHTFSDMPVGWEQSFILSTRHFVDAYFQGEPPSLTGKQGRDILQFALAAQESARKGCAVRVAEVC